MQLGEIVLASDHAGALLRDSLATEVATWDGFAAPRLLGPPAGSEAVDYPEICIEAAELVIRGVVLWAVVIGGSGQGEQMAANKVLGARAALCNDIHYARLARRDNDANVIALGGRMIAPEYAAEILRMWRDTPFEGGRHLRRIDAIHAYERGRG